MEVKGTQLERGGFVSAWRVGLEMPLHPKGHLCFVLGKILALKTPAIHTAYIWKDWWPGGKGRGRED